MNQELKRLVHPNKIYSRVEVLSKDCPIPNLSGIYAWFFKKIPPSVPVSYCSKLDDLFLLYLGIAPKKPSREGKKSSQTLRSRIKFHYRGNVEGSTLRLSLGCLLSEELGIELRRVGSGKRMTFTKSGEEKLSRWMEENAFVSWITHTEPWKLESGAISSLSLPLNLQGNEQHPFYPILSSLRKKAKVKARALSIVPR